MSTLTRMRKQWQYKSFVRGVGEALFDWPAREATADEGRVNSFFSPRSGQKVAAINHEITLMPAVICFVIFFFVPSKDTIFYSYLHRKLV